jgi:hypothetical protein
MATPSDIAAYVSWLVQTKTVIEIQALAVTAAGELEKGDKITSVSFEGGGAGSQLFFTAADRLNACMTAISQLGGTSGITPPTVTRVVFPDFSQMRTET